MRRRVSEAPPPPFSLVKRGTHWCVTGKRSGLAYSSTSYAKAAGVHDFLTQQWEAAREADEASRANARATLGSREHQI